MKQYKLLNNIFGWLAFAIATVVYMITVEPTASFWDCPEFITSAFKLEVGHPPGNSFFNLTGRFFANFAGGDLTKVALMINYMSALCSSATILFLFWTITHLVKKVVVKEDNLITLGQKITILGSGMVGALVYTFSDTFWFSATEAEVYAFSSLMTAVVFWLILKWESHADEEHSDRYIILLAYMIGLSIGVHLLNLLCIPAIILVYYFKKNPNAELKGTLIALTASVVLMGLLLYGMIPGFVRVSGYMELFFVNSLGFSFNTGTMFYFFLVLGVLIWGIYETYVGRSVSRMRISFILSTVLIGFPFVGSGFTLPIILTAAIAAGVYFWKDLNIKLMNTTILCMFAIFLGYSSFAQIIIRSVANPPMDQNAPDEIFSFAKYLNREQYGDRPLLYGHTFVSDIERDNEGRAKTTQGAPTYAKAVKRNEQDKDRYIFTGYKDNYLYQSSLDMLFPRMYSKQDSHLQAYKDWSDFKGKPIRTDKGMVMAPTFGENLKFFFKYQLNFMYWRYFMWNFAGRQNDEQGYGEITKGNWITGFNFIDKHFVGDQSNLPADMAENKGRNVYYMLPLLLGVIGLIYQAYAGQRGIQGFWIVFFLFFMTGIAIVIYLNQTPYQPRERDYAYAGSFYAFSIWIGFGVAGIVHYLQRYLNPTLSATLVSVLALIVPVQMAAQNWDDHDRSGRYTARDFGYNYLTCVEKDGIIFTNGDNDTFPLWYAQEVEGYRTDVRVCNLSYLQTDWYITQMKSPAYDSPPLPIALEPYQYDQQNLNYAYVVNMRKEPMSLNTAMTWLASDDKRTKTISGHSDRIDNIPSDELYIDIDSATVMNSPVMHGVNPDSIVKQMVISLKNKNIVVKNDIAILSMLDGISQDGWKRPIYFATTVGRDMYLNMSPYFSLVGLAYQIVPEKSGTMGTVNTDVMYDNMVNKFLWGGIENPKVYLDENNRRMCRTMRMMFVNLIDALIAEGKNEMALTALEFCMKQIPGYQIPYDYTSMALAQAYFDLDKPQEGTALSEMIAKRSLDNLRWYFDLQPHLLPSVLSDAGHNLAVVQNVMEILRYGAQEELADQYQKEFDRYRMAWSMSQQGYR